MSYDVHLFVICSCDGRTQPEERDVYSSNYTSNCSRMWDEAGCALRPDEAAMRAVLDALGGSAANTSANSRIGHNGGN